MFFINDGRSGMKHFIVYIMTKNVNRNKVMMNNVKMVLSGKIEPENNTYQNEDSISNNGNRSNTEKDTSKDENSLHEMWDNFDVFGH
jgi:hypothetical protein